MRSGLKVSKAHCIVRKGDKDFELILDIFKLNVVKVSRVKA